MCQPRSWLIFDVRQMNARALLVFIPSGMLIPFFWLGSFGMAFAFDAPFRNSTDKFLRVAGASCVFYYAHVWTAALLLTIIGIFRQWHPRTMAILAALPFLIGLAPFLLFALLPYV